jgi:hypothetical protein
MKQVLHIFAKDSRRFWPEILISLAITAAFVLIYPRQWMRGSSNIGFNAQGGFNVLLPTLVSVLIVLVPVSWWLLISRVIHAETLVGDRQFWLTRPYEWKKLLAAKVLFLLVFVYLPFFTAQCLLLLMAGFHPLFWLGGLLFNLLLITGILILPLFALAAVTSNFGKMLLAVLAVLVAIIGVAALYAYLVNDIPTLPYGDFISFVLVLCVCGAVIVLQYASRRYWLSRLILLSALALIGVIAVLPADSSFMQRSYPRPSGPQTQIVQLSFSPDSLHQVTAASEPKAKEVEVNIPLRASGIPDGYAVTPNDVMVSIDAPNGGHWTSPWQAVYAENYLPGSQDFHVTVKINRLFYDQVRSLPVTLHLTFAVTQTRAGKVTRIAMPLRKFFVPDFGICAPETSWDRSGFTGLSCVSALHGPRLTYVSVLWSNTPSDSSGGPPDPNTSVEGASWAGGLDPDPADFGITSVWNVSLGLSNNMQQTDRLPWRPRYLWPGSPITFTQYNLVRRTQADLIIPGFHLPDHNQRRMIFLENHAAR